MITATKKAWLSKGFAHFVKQRLVRRSFDHVRVKCDDMPTSGLVLATHSSWWDGMLLLMCEHYFFHHDTYVLMDEDGLKRFPFFKHLGAFSVKKGSRRDVLQALSHARNLLDDGKTVWVFPQGEEVHQEIRPVHIESGATTLFGRSPVHLCAFYYSFEHESKPSVYIRFRRHTVLEDTHAAQKEELRIAIERLFDDVRADAMRQADDYVSLFPRKATLSEWTERLFGRSETT